MFGDVFILIFLTAISEYDQVIDEDKTTNRIEESLNLFNTILNYPFFMDKDVIVFLNKTDLLKEKIEKGKSLVSEHFPEFTGDDHNVDEVQNFFKVNACFTDKLIFNFQSVSQLKRGSVLCKKCLNIFRSNSYCKTRILKEDLSYPFLHVQLTQKIWKKLKQLCKRRSLTLF